ncbi:MAG TPA: hypothetical protein VF711_11215 [Acidimicrobiales bacterium]|jgi:hypothetical protein
MLGVTVLVTGSVDEQRLESIVSHMSQVGTFRTGWVEEAWLARLRETGVLLVSAIDENAPLAWPHRPTPTRPDVPSFRLPADSVGEIVAHMEELVIDERSVSSWASGALSSTTPNGASSTSRALGFSSTSVTAPTWSPPTSVGTQPGRPAVAASVRSLDQISLATAEPGEIDGQETDVAIVLFPGAGVSSLSDDFEQAGFGDRGGKLSAPADPAAAHRRRSPAGAEPSRRTHPRSVPGRSWANDVVAGLVGARSR